MSESEKLKVARNCIDTLDEQIQNLINKRAECAMDVARIKQSSANKQINFYRPEREADVLRHVQKRNKGPLGNEEIARLFREIMSACLALEQPMRIAYLGPAGTFTQAAALKHFGHSVTTVPLMAIDEIFRDVESGASHYGVVPIENSTEGVVNHTLDTFINSPLKICGEVELRIHQNLLGQMTRIDQVKRIYSHQQSLAQCREWLDANLPGVSRIPVSSNAEAARRVKNEADAAAIAGELAGEQYGLNVIAANIEDKPDNTTRFLMIGRQSTMRSCRDKTSLLLSSRNRSGALHSLLAPFAHHGISMNRIESRPSRRGMWDYVFFVDIEGHQDEPKVAKALAELEKEAVMVKVLGSYPCAVL
ncbi:MAG: prephenate dehydratase [Gammaproteobacteria bacterium]|nr:prephenate dehydratase [Gammaproteobacteria bacterium]